MSMNHAGARPRKTSSRPTTSTIGGMTSGSTVITRRAGRTRGSRRCTQYTVGTIRIMVTSVVSIASWNENQSVWRNSGSRRTSVYALKLKPALPCQRLNLTAASSGTTTYRVPA